MGYTRLKEVDLGKHVNERLYLTFLAKNVEVRLQKDNITEFISFTMCDCGVEVDAKIFGDISSVKETLKNGKVYCCGVDIKPYTKSPTGWSAIAQAPTPDVNSKPTDFLNWNKYTKQAGDIVTAKFNEIGSRYGTNDIYYRIVQTIIANKINAFQTSAAATKNHHNELGGLLVHTAEVLMLCDRLAGFFEERYGKEDKEGRPLINYGLLYAGAILHDIGKLDELSTDVSSGTVEYLPISSVMPHMVRGISVVQEYASCMLGIGIKIQGKTDEQVADERHKLDMLIHCVAAHHGKIEFGSPVEPATIEAYIISKADIISFEICRFGNNIVDMEPGELRKVYVGGKNENIYKGL